MPQITTNTQVDTINVLQEATSANVDDYFLLQRSAVSYKIRKDKIKLSLTQLDDIADYKVLGNITGGGSVNELDIDTISEGLGSTDDTLATSGAIKSYVDTSIQSQQLTFTSGQESASISSAGYIYPPNGKTMANLLAFIPSIANIYFNGDVDNNDTLVCRYSYEATRIKVLTYNSEQRATADFNYLAVWS